MEYLEKYDILKHAPMDYNLKSYTTKPLDSDGLNFSCDVIQMNFLFENEIGEQICLAYINKRVPSLMENQLNFNSKIGFEKEISFYKLLIPEYEKLQIHYGLGPLNVFGKCLFTSDNEILLEDLRQLSFSTCQESLDEEHTRLVLRQLAKFHSTGVVLKLTHPEMFKTKLLQVARPALQNENNPNKEKIDLQFRKEICELLNSMKGFEKFADSVEAILTKIDKTKLPVPSEPYATILHNDLWNGNILFKHSSMNNKSIELKFIDFQNTIYNSPARDLVYFLYTSVTNQVLNDFTGLLKLYHSTFINHLSDLGISVDEFSFERLLMDVNEFGPTKLKHIIKLFKTKCDNVYYKGTFELELQRIILLFNVRGWV